MHHINVFGEVLADIFSDASILGGAPFNVAYHLQAFKQHPLLISRIGQDKLGESCLSRMSAAGMNQAAIQTDAKHQTGQVTVTIENGLHAFTINDHQAYDYIDAEAACLSAQFNPAELIYFGSLIQRNPVSQHALAALLKQSQCQRFVDINLREPWYDKTSILFCLQQANIVKLSGEEIEAVASVLNITASDFCQMAMMMINQFSLKCLLLTLGDQGAWIFSNNGEAYHTPAHAIVGDSQQTDTVGAGDAFTAVAIIGFLNSWPMQQTLERASLFAARICQIRGATPSQTDDFYQPFLAWCN